MAYLTSRLAAGVDYTFYEKGANGINQVVDVISVNGGADVINKKSLDTPYGVVTQIDDERLAKLKTHPVFKQHLKEGYIVINTVEKEAEKIAKDENNNLKQDNSKQLTDKDYTKKGRKKPTTKK